MGFSAVEEMKTVAADSVREKQNSMAAVSNAEARGGALGLGWHVAVDPSTGNEYYYHETTGEVTWDDPATPPALATYLNGAREWTPLHVAADARDAAALRALLRDARVDPRLAVRAVLPDMRTALSIAGSATYPMATA